MEGRQLQHPGRVRTAPKRLSPGEPAHSGEQRGVGGGLTQHLRHGAIEGIDGPGTTGCPVQGTRGSAGSAGLHPLGPLTHRPVRYRQALLQSWLNLGTGSFLLNQDLSPSSCLEAAVPPPRQCTPVPGTRARRSPSCPAPTSPGAAAEQRLQPGAQQRRFHGDNRELRHTNKPRGASLQYKFVFIEAAVT